MKSQYIKHYLNTVKSLIPAEYPQKKQLLAGLEFNINSYISKHPNATMKDIYDVFGSPESIAEQCGYIRVPTEERADSFTIKNIIAIILLIVLLFAVFVILIGTGVLDEYLDAFLEKLSRPMFYF